MDIGIISLIVVAVVVFLTLRKQDRKDQRYFGKQVPHTKRERKILERFKAEYQPIAPDKRLSSLLKDRWELEDIARSATEIIYDGPLPTTAEKRELKPGDVVKLKFMTEEEDRIEVERMWVKIIGFDNGLYQGELDNEPFDIPNLRPGQVVWFHPNHIFEIGPR